MICSMICSNTLHVGQGVNVVYKLQTYNVELNSSQSISEQHHETANHIPILLDVRTDICIE